MKRIFGYISVLLLMLYMFTACGTKENDHELIDYNNGSSMSDDEKDQNYREYLADEVKEALVSRDDINDIEIEITGDADIWSVDVKIDYSDSISDTSELNHSIEESLKKFFPEGTIFSVVTN